MPDENVVKKIFETWLKPYRNARKKLEPYVKITNILISYDVRSDMRAKLDFSDYAYSDAYKEYVAELKTML